MVMGIQMALKSTSWEPVLLWRIRTMTDCQTITSWSWWGRTPTLLDTDNDDIPDGWEWNPYAWRWNAVLQKWEKIPEEFERIDDWFAAGSPEEDLPIYMWPDDPDAYSDDDADGLWNITEYLMGTAPYLSDTDGDGLSDYDEVGGNGGGETGFYPGSGSVTDPNNPDTDGDLLSDYYESCILGSDPLDAEDGLEIIRQPNQLAGNGGATVVLKDDGTVWAWGRNDWGQLGDGTTNQSLSARRVKNLPLIREIDSENAVSLALSHDGTGSMGGVVINMKILD